LAINQYIQKNLMGALFEIISGFWRAYQTWWLDSSSSGSAPRHLNHEELYFTFISGSFIAHLIVFRHRYNRLKLIACIALYVLMEINDF
jgi:hypothetical protein